MNKGSPQRTRWRIEFHWSVGKNRVVDENRQNIIFEDQSGEVRAKTDTLSKIHK